MIFRSMIFIVLALSFYGQAHALCFKVNGKEKCLDKPKRSSRASTPSYTNQQYLCAGGERCLVIYTAPWCANCKIQTPNYNEIIRRTRGTNDLKVMIVVGEERRPGNNRKAAKDFPIQNVKIDEDSKIWRMFGGSKVPFYSLEGREKTIIQGGGAYSSILKEFGIEPITTKGYGAIER